MIIRSRFTEISPQAWMDMGSEGFMVCKYALKVRSQSTQSLHLQVILCVLLIRQRLPGQPPLPEKDADDEDEGEEDSEGSKSESDAGN